jgi:hypothetical protein
MADYLPVYREGDAITLSASATITGGTVVEVSGSGTVGPAGAGSLKVVGVAAFDAASGARVTVYGRGMVHEVVNSGGVTAGDQLITAAAGKVATLAAASGNAAADINAARQVIGIALTTAADTLKVRYLAV